MMIDTEALNRLIAGNAEAIARYYANAPVTSLPSNIRIGNKMGLSYSIAKGLYHDFSTGEGGDGIAFVQALTGCNFADVPDVVARVAGGAVAVTHAHASSAANISHPNVSQLQKQEFALKIWQESKRVTQSMLAQANHPLSLYLKHRGIAAQALQSSDIAFHPQLWHGQTQATHPALVALMRDKAGKAQAIHRIYLSDDGQKLQRDGVNAKTTLGIVKGCAIWLAQPNQGVIGITEGLEDALSVMALCSTPTIALTGTSGLLNVELPASIHELRIFQDNDEAGMIAAQKAERRFIAEGRRVMRIQPRQAHKDFNEWLIATQAPQE